MAAVAAVEAARNSLPPARHLYCIDTRAETFLSLYAILDHTWHNSAPADHAFVRPYLVLACLRLIQANIAQLLRCGRGCDVQQAALLPRLFAALAPPMHPLLPVRPRDRGDGQSADEAKDDGSGEKAATATDSDDESDDARTRTVLTAIHAFVLHLIDEDNTVVGDDASGVNASPMPLVRAEAAAVLMTGFELFYATPAAQAALLASLASPHQHEEGSGEA